MMKLQLRRHGCGRVLYANFAPCEHGNKWRVEVRGEPLSYWKAKIKYPTCGRCHGSLMATEAWKGARATLLPLLAELPEALLPLVKERVEVSSFVEAGLCYIPDDYSLWPYIKDDLYVTCAVYDPASQFIRHVPTGEPLLEFLSGDSFVIPPHDYTTEVSKAAEGYPIEHRISDERLDGKLQVRLRLTYLISNWIRDLPGQHPIATNTLEQYYE